MQVAIPDIADKTPKLRLHPLRDSPPMNEKDYQCCQALKRVFSWADIREKFPRFGDSAAAGRHPRSRALGWHWMRLESLRKVRPFAVKTANHWKSMDQGAFAV